ncbi:hypothetical protein PSYJA_47173, partial [Pseudomonas syringae pv. japonica str. M301072]
TIRCQQLEYRHWALGVVVDGDLLGEGKARHKGE